MKKIYNKKQIYNTLDIDINLRDGGLINPKSMTGLIDNIIVKGDSSGSGSTSLCDVFDGQQPYIQVEVDKEIKFVPLESSDIQSLIEDQGQHEIFYERKPATYCVARLNGSIIMAEASDFSYRTFDSGEGYWVYNSIQ